MIGQQGHGHCELSDLSYQVICERAIVTSAIISYHSSCKVEGAVASELEKHSEDYVFTWHEISIRTCFVHPHIGY